MNQEKGYEKLPLRVTVLLGGNSPERTVSLGSGQTVATALQRQRHSVRLIDPADTDLRSFDWSGIDVVFNMLHGPFGEDGQVQEILEAASLPYTGSGPRASRLAFSKSAAKECFHEAGVPTPEYVLIRHSDSTSRLEALADRIGYPLVVKPDKQGSSIGVHLVHSPIDLVPAVRDCFRFGEFGLIERAITGGGEWTLAVIDSRPLPLIRITPRAVFFDYAAKYEDDRTGYAFEFQEPEPVTQAIVEAGLAACRALEATGIARVDLMLDDDGHPWVLEVNTVPGMTDHSLVPKAALRAGISLPELCNTEIRAALHRYQRRQDTLDRFEAPGDDVQRRAG